MNINESKIDDEENRVTYRSKKKKKILIQSRMPANGIEIPDRNNPFCRCEWWKIGKYEEFVDALNAMIPINRNEKHIFHNHEFRVLVHGEVLFENPLTPEQMIAALMSHIKK